MTDTWQMVADLACRLDDHSTLPREQRVLFQLLKIQEEAGEVAEAAIGAAGQTPQGPFPHLAGRRIRGLRRHRHRHGRPDAYEPRREGGLRPAPAAHRGP
ncbi:hypothetical protein ACR6C2_36240 [Streptomyces sp. INA 01156]